MPFLRLIRVESVFTQIRSLVCFLLSSHLNGVLVAQCVREVGPVCLVIEKMSLASIFTAATIQPAPLHVHKETNEVLRGVGVLGHH